MYVTYACTCALGWEGILRGQSSSRFHAVLHSSKEFLSLFPQGGCWDFAGENKGVEKFSESGVSSNTRALFICLECQPTARTYSRHFVHPPCIFVLGPCRLYLRVKHRGNVATAVSAATIQKYCSTVSYRGIHHFPPGRFTFCVSIWGRLGLGMKLQHFMNRQGKHIFHVRCFKASQLSFEKCGFGIPTRAVFTICRMLQ